MQLYNSKLLVKSPEHRVLLCKDYTAPEPFFEDAASILEATFNVCAQLLHTTCFFPTQLLLFVPFLTLSSFVTLFAWFRCPKC